MFFFYKQLPSFCTSDFLPSCLFIGGGFLRTPTWKHSQHGLSFVIKGNTLNFVSILRLFFQGFEWFDLVFLWLGLAQGGLLGMHSMAPRTASANAANAKVRMTTKPNDR